LKTPYAILLAFLFCSLLTLSTRAQQHASKVDFFGDPVELPGSFQAPVFNQTLSPTSVQNFLNALEEKTLLPYLTPLQQYKKEKNPDDWLFYQLIRKVSQHISPKADNYYRYTFYKWWFLKQTGYDARLLVSGNYLLFYVQCDESIYNIPYRVMEGKQYVCLNYHDYGSIDFEKYRFTDVTPASTTQAKAFTYKVSRLPDFNSSDYSDKEVQFSDGINQYAFRIKLNPQVKTLFTNYPVVDYDLQFNMPLSKATYESLIPSLKKQVQGMKQRDGVEFLMRFTRYAFLFKPDAEVFGSEKRLTPEQTLLYEYSDCEDRAALFFFLVKEIYNLPMLVLTYPQHVTVAIQFDKAYGKTVEYNGMKYSICEPSPQKIDLRVGQISPELRNQSYQIAYTYHPVNR